MLKSMSMHKRDRKRIINFNFVTLGFAFKGPIPTIYLSQFFICNHMFHFISIIIVL